MNRLLQVGMGSGNTGPEPVCVVFTSGSNPVNVRDLSQ